MDENLIKTFNYEGSPITFQTGNGVIVNATLMAKPFGKLPKDWIKTQQTKELVNELLNRKKILFSDLVQVREGSPDRGGGTWLHEDLALVFAQWLSPDFYIWCNDRIKELLTQGVATVSDDDDVIARAMEVLQKRLEAKQKELENSKQRVMMLEGQTEQQQKQIGELAPKAEYTDTVLMSTTTYTMTEVAKEFGYSAVTFSRKLRECGILFQQSGRWMLTAKYQGKGFMATRTHQFYHNDGTVGTNTISVWTEAGRKFLHDFRDGKYNSRRGSSTNSSTSQN